MVEGRFQEADSARAAGAALEADDALHRLHVAESPLLEPVFQIDQLFGQFVQVKVLLGVAIDLEPGIAHGIVGT